MMWQEGTLVEGGGNVQMLNSWETAVKWKFVKF